MAWTVIYGLVFATFLTLVLVPVMLWLLYKSRRGMRRMISKYTYNEEEAAEPLAVETT